ncbi:MAG: hypothetical protein NTV98_02630 [Candidatus Roizmanbacteria bacterium]|nr:hypothetical protein [Candidatus Roizmanbacteria bacterium]
MKKYKNIIRLTALTILTVLVGMLVFQFHIAELQAATLTSAKDVISTSRPGVAAIHTFTFTTPSSTAIKTILFQFCTAASGTCTAPSGMILTAVPTLGTVTGIAGTGYAAAGTSGTCTGTGNTDCTATLTVTTPTTQTVTAVTVPFNSGITNPSTASTVSFVRVTTRDTGPTTIDTNTVAFAVLTSTSMAMTAGVDPTLTFSIAAVSSGAVNTATINVSSGTGPAVIPFGTLTSGSTKIAAHDVTVSTNGLTGYTVTVAALANPPLADGSNNIDVFTGTNAAPTSWSSPAGSAASANTGFFGYTTEENALGTGTAARFTTSPPKWAGVITTPEEIIYNATGAVNQTTRIGWQVEINALQPAGSYVGSVLLVATPTY